MSFGSLPPRLRRCFSARFRMVTILAKMVGLTPVRRRNFPGDKPCNLSYLDPVTRSRCEVVPKVPSLETVSGMERWLDRLSYERGLLTIQAIRVSSLTRVQAAT